MRYVRFNHNRLGVVDNDRVFDITGLFKLTEQWPAPAGDMIVRQLVELETVISSSWKDQPSLLLSEVRLDSPITNPSKVIGAPINYKAHIDEANADAEINTGKTYTSIDQFGLFLKANSSIVGPADFVLRRFDERRTDHEVELAVIIGREAKDVKREDALDYVFGYCASLDMTVRGSEFPCFRKSVDSYTVLGPWIVTKDEIADPNNLDLLLTVNGEQRQKSNTSHLIFDVQRLIEYASSFFTLHPGDVIMTGTPEGVGPVFVGDKIVAVVDSVGTLEIGVGHWPQ